MNEHLAKLWLHAVPIPLQLFEIFLLKLFNYKVAVVTKNIWGLPSLIDKKKKRGASIIKTRVWKKLDGWNGKLLSRRGKEVLIKAVA